MLLRQHGLVKEQVQVLQRLRQEVAVHAVVQQLAAAVRRRVLGSHLLQGKGADACSIACSVACWLVLVLIQLLGAVRDTPAGRIATINLISDLQGAQKVAAERQI